MSLTEEERKKYDRNRFIGRQAQLKLKNSCLLVIGIDGINTQLAKNIILLGCKVALADSAIISERDVENNFLVAPDDLGKPRAAVIAKKLQQINDLVKVEVLSEGMQIEDILKNNIAFQSRFIAISVACSDLTLVKRWYDLASLIKIPIYVNSNWGFYAISIACMGGYTSGEGKAVPSFQQTFYKVKCQNNLKSALLVAKKAQDQGMCINPYTASQQQLASFRQKIMKISAGLKIKQELNQLCFNFARLREVQFCPVYSVVGSIISQELIKVAGKKIACSGWLVYDSQDGYAQYMTPSQSQ